MQVDLAVQCRNTLYWCEVAITLVVTSVATYCYKLCDTLQAVAPTKVKTVHQTSLLGIESNLDRLGLLSPTHGRRSQDQSGQIHATNHFETTRPSFSRPNVMPIIRKIGICRSPWWWTVLFIVFQWYKYNLHTRTYHRRLSFLEWQRCTTQ